MNRSKEKPIDCICTFPHTHHFDWCPSFQRELKEASDELDEWCFWQKIEWGKYQAGIGPKPEEL